MTTKEAALSVDMSQDHIRRLVRDQVIPARRLPNGYMDIDPRAFQEWRKGREQKLMPKSAT